jgi:hypothetical protein
MHVTLTRFIILLGLVVLVVFCGQRKVELKEEDKIFHAGPSMSGFGSMFFGLYKDNKYQFCDGDFMNPGCYTGDYTLSGDTITLNDLKKHPGIPSNRFFIYRLKEKDPTNGSEGKVFPLSGNNQIIDDGKNYFLIRFDLLTNSH